MATYLLTWNPKLTDWDDLQDSIREIRTHGYYSGSWSSGVTKKITLGDRVFLIKLGKELPRGIMSSGWVTSEKVYPGPHWNKTLRAKRKTALYIDVDFDTVLDPQVDAIFPRAKLDDGIYAKMHWDAQASGTAIADDIAVRLEVDWARFLKRSAQPKELHVAKTKDITKAYHQVDEAGAGFGTPEANRKIELAAIKFVTKHYKSQGWQVQSIEADRRGFDLFCTKGPSVEHVEVKGIKGNVESFIITAREVGQARIDRSFVLCVVTSAISKHPKFSRYTADRFLKGFALTPVAFRASPLARP